MIYIRHEGEPVRNGFNFYPLSDTGSAGFILRLFSKCIWVRYSKRNKKWIIKYESR